MKLAINESSVILIYAKLFWNFTNIEINKGEVYKFEAEGIWRDLYKKTDPEGYTNFYMNLFNSLKRSQGHKWFALMGNLDKSYDFLIGKSQQISFSEKGNLYCYANDAKGFYWNNSGKVAVKIRRIN
ncbi:MAG: hypothetical protein V4556_00550 [Bacteroidota bacterium]